jgi:hypothetical protein
MTPLMLARKIKQYKLALDRQQYDVDPQDCLNYLLVRYCNHYNLQLASLVLHILMLFGHHETSLNNNNNNNNQKNLAKNSF